MNKKVVRIVLIGLMAAIIAALSQVQFPLPSGVPVTLQTFAVALCGYFLGPVWGLVSVLVYVALGAVGVPVFAGFSGGFGTLVGVTGGYIWGFLPMVFLCGFGAKKNRILAIVFGLLGLVCCHLPGVLQFALVSGSGDPMAAFLLASAPYLVKDIVSVVGAYAVSVAILSAMKAGGVQYQL